MMSDLYYPQLKRRDIKEYSKSKDEFYATYNCKTNYHNTLLDCKYRCVYCDAHIDECGGEPFSLDHFRPTDIFGEKFGGILKTHPFNLHLSCQKCNVLKTNDWKGCIDTRDGATYLHKQGYIDRFQVDITDYLEVDRDGQIQCKNSEGPVKYMIGKLLLNRTNRIYIRKRRAVKDKATRIQTMLIRKQKELLLAWKSKQLKDNEFQKEMELLMELFDKFERLNLMNI